MSFSSRSCRTSRRSGSTCCSSSHAHCPALTSYGVSWILGLHNRVAGSSNCKASPSHACSLRHKRARSSLVHTSVTAACFTAGDFGMLSVVLPTMCFRFQDAVLRSRWRASRDWDIPTSSRLQQHSGHSLSVDRRSPFSCLAE